MLEKFSAGLYVQLTILERKTYIGEISFINKSFDRLELRNAVHVLSATKLGTLKCYKSEISSMTLLQSDCNEVAECCNFTFSELNELSQFLNNYIFIERFDVKYHNAIADMQVQTFIGLYIAGAERGQFCKTSLIVVSTSSNIYLFDIKLMDKIEKGLKKVLEDDVPKKIVHDSDMVADNLFHNYDVVLAGVFDTMVSHVALGFNNNLISLRECLEYHLNIPDEFMEEPDPENWQRRPLSLNQKVIAAQNVIFLKKLKAKLTRLMLTDSYSVFDKNLKFRELA